MIDRADDALYLFDPETLAFDLLGELDCGLFAGSPASMSVTRDGFAYVRYTDNTVYAVDLDTLECTETAYGGSGFGAFGMGFATDSDTTWRDTLYIANDNQLARMDTATWTVSPMGSLPSQSELTGNADGELWAILPLEEPAQLVRLNKDTAAVEHTLHMTAMPDPYTIDAFAFATWGGDFWVFIRTYGMGHSTDVYRVTSTGHTTRVAVDTGMDVVGAGVAPAPPRAPEARRLDSRDALVLADCTRHAVSSTREEDWEPCIRFDVPLRHARAPRARGEWGGAELVEVSLKDKPARMLEISPKGTFP